MRLGVTRALRDFTRPRAGRRRRGRASTSTRPRAARRRWRRSPAERARHPAAGPQAAGISGLDVLDTARRAARRHADDHDHRLRLARDRGHAPPSAAPTTSSPSRSRPTSSRATVRKAAAPPDPRRAGPQAGRGEAAGPLPVHLACWPRAQGAAGRRRGLPAACCRTAPPATTRPPTTQMLDRSLVRIEGMRKLIVDLLDLTRIESGQKQRELRRVDVREVARAAIETVAPEAAARGIAVELHADGAGADDGRPRRDRDHPQQPGLQRGQVQPRRRPGRRHACADADGQVAHRGRRHRHRHDAPRRRHSCSASSCASRTTRPATSSAAGWAVDRQEAGRCSTAATYGVRARRTSAAPSPSTLRSSRPRSGSGQRRRAARSPRRVMPCAGAEM